MIHDELDSIKAHLFYRLQGSRLAWTHHCWITLDWFQVRPCYTGVEKRKLTVRELQIIFPYKSYTVLLYAKTVLIPEFCFISNGLGSFLAKGLIFFNTNLRFQKLQINEKVVEQYQLQQEKKHFAPSRPLTFFWPLYYKATLMPTFNKLINLISLGNYNTLSTFRAIEVNQS